MPMRYPVEPGVLVLCDFNRGGFQPPEMVKKRPVIVVSPRQRGTQKVHTVVPCSTTPPNRVQAFDLNVTLERPLPSPFDASEFWVKIDMVTTMSLDRCDLFRTGRDFQGKRRYLQPRLDPEQFDSLRERLKIVLGLS